MKKIRYYNHEALDLEIRIQGLSKKEVAENSNTTKQNISGYCLGKWRPSLKKLQSICINNNIDIRRLFLAEDEKADFPPEKAEKTRFDPAKLNRAIKARGYNNTSLADKIGMHNQTISNYCTGEKLPALDTLEKICETLEWDIRDMFSPID